MARDPSFLPTPGARAVRSALILGLALGTLAAAPVAAQVQASTQGAAQARRKYDIGAGPLDRALTGFAGAAGVELSVDAALIQGKNSPGLAGAYTVQEGFTALLRGHDLQVIRGAGGAYSLRAAPAGSPGAAADTSTLQTVTVTAASEQDTATSPVRGYAATRSASATKTDTPLTEVPQSISVVGREEMEARGVQNLAAAIGYTPGVIVNTYGPDNRGWDDIMLRGFSTYYASYLDGLVQTPSGVTYYLTEPYGLERVEVLRGPSSMTFGQGDAGGIINRVSKRPTGERIREIQLQLGSHDRRQLAFDVGDSIAANEDLSLRLVGLALDSNDQDEYPNGQKLNRERVYLAPSLRWQPSAATSLTLTGEYLRHESAEDPYYIGSNGVLSNVKMGDPGFSGIKTAQTSLGYQFEHRIDEAWTLRQNFRASRVELQRNVIWLDSLLPDGHTYSRFARTWNDPTQQSALDTQLTGKFRTGAAQHTLQAGVDWNRLEADASRFRGPAPDLDLLNPQYNQFIPTPTSPLADYTQTSSQLGFYLQDQIKVGEHWVFTLGGRQDRVKSFTQDHLNAADTRQSDSAFTGRAGINYLVDNGWAPYISYAGSFLPNSGLDANNDPFKPSRGDQVEVGVKYQPVGSRSLFTAAVFDLRKTNVVTYDNITFDARQIGKQRSRGLELEAKTELARGLKATAAFTALDMSVLQSADATEVGKSPPGVPRVMASFWLDYALGNGFGVGAGVNHTGVRQNDEANTTAERSFTIADALLRYEQGPWRVALNITNLFNRKYHSICYHGECYQGAERAVVLTTRYRF